MKLCPYLCPRSFMGNKAFTCSNTGPLYLSMSWRTARAINPVALNAEDLSLSWQQNHSLISYGYLQDKMSYWKLCKVRKPDITRTASILKSDILIMSGMYNKYYWYMGSAMLSAYSMAIQCEQMIPVSNVKPKISKQF